MFEAGERLCITVSSGHFSAGREKRLY